MRPWLKRSFIGLFGASVLTGGLAACSHGMHAHHGAPPTEAEAAQMRTRMVERIGKELTLDAAQQQRLATLADKLNEQRSALMGAADPRAQVQSLVAGAAFDRAKAQALVEAKTAAVAAKSPELISAAADFYDSLRPEQQQKVREFMTRGRGRGWGWRG